MVSESEEHSKAEIVAMAKLHYGPDYPIDVRLWFTNDECEGRDYLTGNPHTFPGRLGAYCPHSDQGFNVSKNQIRTLSPEAELWLAGFLAGNEPHPAEEGDEAQWDRAVVEFRRTGQWPLDD